MNYSELAWLLLEQRRPVDEVCKRTGFPRVLVERMAVDMEKQQAIKQAERAVRKAERQVELAAIRMERGCPMCNTGYANVDTITMYGEGNGAQMVGDIMTTMSKVSEGMGLNIPELLQATLTGRAAGNAIGQELTDTKTTPTPTGNLAN